MRRPRQRRRKRIPGFPTATSFRAASPLAQTAGAPFLAPFTGAEFLRDPELVNVLNLRASYYQETAEMVARLTEDLGITHVAVLYQDDSFGLNGLEGVQLALERGPGTRCGQALPAQHQRRKGSGARNHGGQSGGSNMIGAHEPVVKTDDQPGHRG